MLSALIFGLSYVTALYKLSLLLLLLLLLSCDQMVNSFYDLTLSLLDEFLSPKVVKHCTNDTPWVTDQFRSLIQRRQAAWSSKVMTNYRRLRNKINRNLPKLKKHNFCYQITPFPNYELSQLVEANKNHCRPNYSSILWYRIAC